MTKVRSCGTALTFFNWGRRRYKSK